MFYFCGGQGVRVSHTLSMLGQRQGCIRGRGGCAGFIELLGANGVTLCDTTGMAYPTQVAELTAAFRARWPHAELTLHFHNTRGMGLANVLAAIDAGADRFDASIGGIGGCPYAPGASGNVCTEDIAHALELMGYDTGIDLPLLLQACKRLPELIGHDIPSQIVKAGQRKDLSLIHNVRVDDKKGVECGVSMNI